MTKRQQQNLSKSRDGGYTIIESLVAMIVVSVLMIAIAPVMAFSVATRVQARRVELATQAARTYIDALRTGAIKPSNLPQFPAADTTAIPAAPADIKPLYCVDFDEDPANCNGNKDFRVQGVRQSAINANNIEAKKAGYALTVRVYRADATGPFTATSQSIVGAALVNSKAPLVVMNTEIPPAPEGGASAYRSICARTNGCK